MSTTRPLTFQITEVFSFCLLILFQAPKFYAFAYLIFLNFLSTPIQVLEFYIYIQLIETNKAKWPTRDTLPGFSFSARIHS